MATKTGTANGKPVRELRIGEMLVEAKIISKRQLEESLSIQEQRGGKIGDVLVELGHMDPRAFIRFLAQIPGVPSISLKNCRVSKDLLALFPQEYLTEHEVFPIDRMGKLLTVGMVCPLDKKIIADMQERVGLTVKPILITRRDVREAIDYYLRGSNEAILEMAPERKAKWAPRR